MSDFTNSLRHSLRWAQLVGLLLAFAPICMAEEAVYDVGVAKIDVTPAYPIRLNGFGGRRDESEGVTQRIWAKAIAIGSDEAKPAVLITLDSLGVREAMVDEVARRLKEKAGIDRDRVAVTFSHSHTTPKLTNVCDTIFSSPISSEHQAHIERYTAELTDAMEKVALEALADRKPSTLSWAVGKVSFAVNRRTPGGPVDHDLPILVVKSADDGAVRAIYLSYACHCVTLSDNKISGDWSGYAQEAVERTHPGIIALVSIGCGSDSNPASGVTGSNTAAAADQGAQICDEVDRLLAGTLKPVSGELTAALSHIDIPLNPVPVKEELEKLAAAGGAPGYNAEYQLAKLQRGEELQAALDYPVQTWAFGDSLAMVFLAGEVCADYSLRLKAELDPERIWMHGYSNDFCAYIPSERLLKEGGYGGGAEVVYFALPNTIATGVEEKIIGQVHAQIPPQFEGAGPRKQVSAQPWPLEEAVASIVPKPGFVVEVAAAEPLVADPVAIDFGPDGRLWVAEMPDYSRFADEDFKPNGSVRVLTDGDGDGKYDEAKTFADGLRFPTDVKSWRNGVIVCDAPDVIYLEDADGDGKADVRKVLLTGFETHNAQARVNSLRWGLDNWLYGSCGLFGGMIKTSSGREIQLGGRDFRFHPDSGELEPVTGSTQQGRTRDDWNNWFGCDNSSLIHHYPLDDHYLARNPHIAPPATRISVPGGPDPSALHPIGEPSIFQLSGPPGRPTAACGLDIYRDELLGSEFSNNSFVAEPVNQLVHRRILSPNGATFTGARAADEPDVEFLASTDPWFRPVQIRTGLDGCLYVVDMHRAVIEHQKFIPETLAELDVTAGREQGRIFRVRRADVPPRPTTRLDHLNAAGLAAAIDSPNGPLRDLAQQLLLQRHATEAAHALKQLAQKAARPAVRLQALCTLDGLGELDVPAILAALADGDPAVRRHAIRLSEPMLATAPNVLDALLALADDADPQVELQLAYTLGETQDPRTSAALAKIALRQAAEPTILAGVWSSVNSENAGQVVEALFAQSQGETIPDSVLKPSIRLIAELGSDADVLGAAKSLGGKEGAAELASWRFAAAAELLEQSRRRSEAANGLQKQFAPLADQARTILENPQEEAASLAALKMVAATGVDSDELLELLTPLLEPQHSPTVQQAAIEMIAAIGGDAAAETLLSPWRGYTPAARSQAFDVMLGSADLTGRLLSHLEAGTIAVTDLDALQRQRLANHPAEELRARGAAIMASGVDQNRDKIVKEYIAAVAANGEGDAGSGRQTFAKYCSSCHRLEDQGHEVGPDLAALTSRASAALIESILDPNRAVDERFRSYSALTVDGLAHAGIMTGETSTSITLTEQQGKQHTLLRTDLDALENTGKSLMPEGLEKDLAPAAVADLLAYLNSVGPPAKTVEGNNPKLIAPDYDGTLWLLAEHCHIYGAGITFEKPFRNIGYWHGRDEYVTWQIDAPAPQEYEVYLHWATVDDTAGSSYILEGGEKPVTGQVAGTGSYSRFQTQRIGRMKLVAGKQRLILRPDGPLKTANLMDLRGVYLTPVGVPADRAISGDPPQGGEDAATAISKLLDGLAVGQPEEYERIPAIWEHAIAAGRRNQHHELLRVMDLALPGDGEPLADWQAVVIGGGVVNGVSQAGAWPNQRLMELLKEHPQLQAEWNRTMTLAAQMAANEQVHGGTRYDALRILGAGSWETFGPDLVEKLSVETSPELQMGLVSALADMDADEVGGVLVTALSSMTDHNRSLAIEALLRTPGRAEVLLNAVDSGKVAPNSVANDILERAKSVAKNGPRNP
ncbi:neutral/alkaline non-lysosomal ceramidase N-terminal domain-containing protein [Lacipirellula sp.]|uniref:neutral/alkaline non-lysosomal ceramidase N-terminal domain-containing protein n=1 Tax=Lacipirellula sp. TaxID=2691419 RepID=UPI003D143DDE